MDTPRKVRTKAGWARLISGGVLIVLAVLGGVFGIFGEEPNPQPWWSLDGWARWFWADPNGGVAAYVTALASIAGGVLGVWGFFFSNATEAIIHSVEKQGAQSAARDARTHDGIEEIKTQNVDLAVEIARLRRDLIGGAPEDVPPPDAGTVEAATQAIAATLGANDEAREPAQVALRAEDFEGAARKLMAAADADASAAAARFREAGAIAVFRNVTLAIQAYSRAAEIEPGHFWTQVELSRLWLRNGDLDGSSNAAAAAQLCAQADRERVIALDAEANVRLRRGDLSGASAAYEEVEQIFRNSTEAGDAQGQRDLSVSLNKIGGVRARQGDLAGELEA